MSNEMQKMIQEERRGAIAMALILAVGAGVWFGCFVKPNEEALLARTACSTEQMEANPHLEAETAWARCQ